MQQVQEQADRSPEIDKKLDDLKTRLSDVHNKVVDQQQTIEDVVPAAITCEEAWEELEPHLNDIETRLKKITVIPVEHKGLTKQQNILKVCIILCFTLL
jgi:tetrahydromethanopterin S-methyltransferase subunit G